MQITAALRDALDGRVHLLARALTDAGHAHRGLTLTDRELLTSDANGNPVDLSPAAQVFVNNYVPPARPAAPDWGADLPTNDELMEQAAQAVQQIRAYRALSSPTPAQQKAYENLIGRIAMHYLRSRFPQLGG